MSQYFTAVYVPQFIVGGRSALGGYFAALDRSEFNIVDEQACKDTLQLGSTANTNDMNLGKFNQLYFVRRGNRARSAFYRHSAELVADFVVFVNNESFEMRAGEMPPVEVQARAGELIGLLIANALDALADPEIFLKYATTEMTVANRMVAKLSVANRVAQPSPMTSLKLLGPLFNIAFDISRINNFDFVVRAEDATPFLDHSAAVFLKQQLDAIETCSRVRLVPLHTTGDGNCLAHAISLSLIGSEILFYTLRQQLYHELLNNREFYILAFGSEDVYNTALQLSNRPGEAVEPVCVLGFANLLRRPICLMTGRRESGKDDERFETVQDARFANHESGLYLPTRFTPEECVSADGTMPGPLCIAWAGESIGQMGHYVAVVRHQLTSDLFEDASVLSTNVSKYFYFPLLAHEEIVPEGYTPSEQLRFKYLGKALISASALGDAAARPGTKFAVGALPDEFQTEYVTELLNKARDDPGSLTRSLSDLAKDNPLITHALHLLQLEREGVAHARCLSGLRQCIEGMLEDTITKVPVRFFETQQLQDAGVLVGVGEARAITGGGVCGGQEFLRALGFEEQQLASADAGRSLSLKKDALVRRSSLQTYFGQNGQNGKKLKELLQRGGDDGSSFKHIHELALDPNRSLALLDDKHQAKLRVDITDFKVSEQACPALVKLLEAATQQKLSGPEFEIIKLALLTSTGRDWATSGRANVPKLIGGLLDQAAMYAGTLPLLGTSESKLMIHLPPLLWCFTNLIHADSSTAAVDSAQAPLRQQLLRKFDQIMTVLEDVVGYVSLIAADSELRVDLPSRLLDASSTVVAVLPKYRDALTKQQEWRLARLLLKIVRVGTARLEAGGETDPGGDTKRQTQADEFDAQAVKWCLGENGLGISLLLLQHDHRSITVPPEVSKMLSALARTVEETKRVFAAVDETQRRSAHTTRVRELCEQLTGRVAAHAPRMYVLVHKDTDWEKRARGALAIVCGMINAAADCQQQVGAANGGNTGGGGAHGKTFSGGGASQKFIPIAGDKDKEVCSCAAKPRINIH
jgi:hypothetical protein